MSFKVFILALSLILFFYGFYVLYGSDFIASMASALAVAVLIFASSFKSYAQLVKTQSATYDASSKEDSIDEILNEIEDPHKVYEEDAQEGTNTAYENKQAILKSIDKKGGYFPWQRLASYALLFVVLYLLQEYALFNAYGFVAGVGLAVLYTVVYIRYIRPSQDIQHAYRNEA